MMNSGIKKAFAFLNHMTIYKKAEAFFVALF